MFSRRPAAYGAAFQPKLFGKGGVGVAPALQVVAEIVRGHQSTPDAVLVIVFPSVPYAAMP